MVANSYSNVRRFIASQTGVWFTFMLFIYLSYNTFNRYQPNRLLYCPSLNCEVELHHSCCMCCIMVESCWHLYAIWTLIRKVSQLFLCLLIHCINTTTNLSTTFSSFTWLLMGWPRLVGSLVLGLFCKRALSKKLYSASTKETYIFKSLPIVVAL